MVGRVMDRCVFWALPGWVKAYRPRFPLHSFFYRGMEVWYVPGAPEGPTVLFCHGNSGNLRFPRARGERFLALHQAGAHLWAFDYRGYGLSEGTPSEGRVYEDAWAVHGLARHYHPEGRPFVLFGRSLGGAVATYLAAEVQQPNLLILESTFTSVPDVCACYTHRWLAGWMGCQFDSARRVASLSCPLRMLHGTADKVVPYRLGRQLFDCYPGPDKELVTVPGAGHNDLMEVSGPLYVEKLRSWLGCPGSPGAGEKYLQ
jgi:pimeloyl-ACP methyl ester carboxylesterase